ncbi:hypothetical protein BCON_0060g00160 [Botryotinia convoluta]|uniref:Rhodopsin domain-containing protein n=1 Tax=Botryotinia convoluta TaxID=54673 RepID=A0A4Z1IEF7_9HELO|nr:hypothetical protein BCON_0060g00160 [Botryotinia convoluta]
MQHFALGFGCGLDVLTDAMILVIPISMLWTVRLSRKRKLALAGIFSLVIITIIFSIVRQSVVSSYSHQFEESWLYTWSLVEQTVAIVIACLASFRSLFARNSPAQPTPPNPYADIRKTTSSGNEPEDIVLRPQDIHIISGGHYELSINKTIVDTTNQLFHTTIESRSAALDFYRIRPPLARGHIRINPEYNVLFLQDWDKAPQMLADVLHDIRAYDPRDEGLMHLALAEGSGDSLFDIPHPSHILSGYTEMVDFGSDTFLNSFHDEAKEGMQPDNEVSFYNETLTLLRGASQGRRDRGMGHGTSHVPHHHVAIASLVDILSTKLRSLWCVEKLLCDSRIYDNIGLRMGRPHLSETCPIMPSMKQMGRSSVNFEWLESDPRPIQPDLKQLAFWRDPRRFYHSWCVLKGILGVRRTTNFNSYVCVTTQLPPLQEWGEDVEQHVSTKPGVRQMVDLHRENELAQWEESLEFYKNNLGMNIPKHGFLRDEESYKELERNPSTAIGMWIFSGKAFGQVNGENICDVYGRFKEHFEMSEVPGLAVFDI